MSQHWWQLHDCFKESSLHARRRKIVLMITRWIHMQTMHPFVWSWQLVWYYNVLYANSDHDVKVSKVKGVSVSMQPCLMFMHKLDREGRVWPHKTMVSVYATWSSYSLCQTDMAGYSQITVHAILSWHLQCLNRAQSRSKDASLFTSTRSTDNFTSGVPYLFFRRKRRSSQR